MAAGRLSSTRAFPFMSKELQVGDAAPVFKAVAVGGKYGDCTEVSLAGLKGRTVVLYFYPKDDTPGCTAQACALRDAWPDFEGKAAIFGVSTDSAASHAKFIKKYSLPFPLLVDDAKQIVNDYGVWVEKSIYGKKYMGTERSTFVISPQGEITAILRKVKPAGHAAELLAAI
jgi:peroxiredoxin Q/BCP